MMDEHTQYGATEDYFDAVLASDGIAVRMSDNVGRVLILLVGRLIRFLETGEVEAERRGPLRRARSADKVRRHMFPEAYRDRAESQSFRERHAAALRDSTAPRRVYARCANHTGFVIDHAEVDDWLVTLGLARFLVLPRDAPTPDMTGVWLNHMQESLITAVNPRLVNLTADWTRQTRTIRRGP